MLNHAVLGFAAICVTVWSSGCGPKASDGGFDSDNPAAKLYAIHAAGEARDKNAVPRLIDELDSDDQAVRMMAIHALEQITGTRMGYNPYKDRITRLKAIDTWVRSYQMDADHIDRNANTPVQNTTTTK